MLILFLFVISISTAHAHLSSVEGSGEGGLSSNETMEDDQKLANLVLRSATICAHPSETETFIRVPQALVMGIPTIVSTAEMIACAAFCRNNTEPLSGLARLCKGFNFQSNVVPTCEFFDDMSKVGALNRNVGVRSYYFDKICLPADRNYCGDRSFAFDVIANARLDGEASRKVWTRQLTDCLTTCLNETAFTCHALNYDIKHKTCELFSVSRRSMEANFSRNVKDVDYYENNCLDKETRCPTGQIGFIKLAHTGIRGFDVSAGVKLLADCLLDCIESRVLFCRSVEYDAGTNECYVSEEDTVTSEKHIVTDPTVGVDLYEPVCLPGLISSKCTQSYVYEKMRATYMYAARTLSTLVELKLENCLLACMHHGECRALNFDKSTGNCELLPFGRTSKTASMKAVPNIDFYELTCARENDRSSLFNSARFAGKSSVEPFFVLNDDESRKEREPSPTPLWTTDFMTTNTAFSTEAGSGEADIRRVVHGKRPLASFDDTKENKVKIQEKTLATRSVDSSEETTKGSPVYGICGFRFQAQDRRIRVEYRTDRTNIPNLKQCQKLCEIIAEFHCVSVSYSATDRLCGLSDFNLDDYPLDELTEDEGGSNFYGREVCLLQNGASSEVDEVRPTLKVADATVATPITSPPPSPLMTLRRDSTGTARAPATPRLSPISPSSSGPSTHRAQPPATRPDTHTPGTPSVNSPTATTTTTTTSSPSSLLLKPTSRVPASTSASQSDRLNSVAENIQQRSLPRIMAVGNTLPPNDIIVEATCLQEGVNITISVKRGTYTGAVYAAERFAECRNIVLEEEKFWLYLPRPSTNSACNTLEVKDIMTGVIVISNDKVLPHDVTTKDDLFYQISCNYTVPPLPVQRRFFFRSGVVVGGPQPRVVSADELERPARDLDVRMRILRNGNSVDSVLIGEQLTLSIESSEPAKNMKLMNCNVTRIGGGSPAPLPLRLVEDGCAIMSQIIGPVKEGSKGLEATLTAFRIDGSAEIEFDCEVMFCREGCSPTDCDVGGNDSIEGNKKRARRAIVESAAGGELVETVDGRLRVFMEGEKGAPNRNDIASGELQYDSRTDGRRCMSEAVFMASVGCLSAILLIVIIAFTCLFLRKSLLAQLIQPSIKSVDAADRPVHNSDYMPPNRRRFGKKASFREAFVFSKARSNLGVDETLDRPHVSKSSTVASQIM